MWHYDSLQTNILIITKTMRSGRQMWEILHCNGPSTTIPIKQLLLHFVFYVSGVWHQYKSAKMIFDSSLTYMLYWFIHELLTLLEYMNDLNALPGCILVGFVLFNLQFSGWCFVDHCLFNLQFSGWCFVDHYCSFLHDHCIV